ncbi:YdeI/OmpD-associated family protein [Tropicibacter sp. S64]|uniref:YdeI/OmpD-associated family protein n=1 Tax=Tropicibacter sp. S64 TaxID=3415122 RepID=UPI003C7D073D
MTDIKAKLDAHFEKPGPWQAERRALRAIMESCPVREEMKWHQPVYTAHGGNVAIIGAFKDFCTLSFFKGALLEDPEGILEPPGANSRAARLFKVTDLAQVRARAGVLKGYVLEAVELERTGAKVDLPPDDFDLPEELGEALEADPALAEAWDSLTPGRRRSWALRIGEAKKTETRAARVEKATPLILQGKGIHDR